MSEEGTCSFYISDFADEMNPCEPTLEGWAEWLSAGGDAEWRVAVPDEGATFKCHVTRWQADIVASRVPGGNWSFSREPSLEGGFMAVRYGPGLGWSPDNIVYGNEHDLRQWFDENDEDCDDEEYIAVGVQEGPVLLKYHADPPRLTVEGRVQ